jgi:hypothetical protein
VTVSVAADGRLAVRYRLGHENALYRLQMAKDGKPQKLTKGNLIHPRPLAGHSGLKKRVAAQTITRQLPRGKT